MDQQAVRTRLTQMLTDLDSSRDTLENENAGDSSSELSHLDQHPADTASEVSDQAREQAVLGVVGDQRAQVVAALSRLDDGTFGSCADCGGELSEERLDARPEAARCVACQSKSEEAR